MGNWKLFKIFGKTNFTNKMIYKNFPFSIINFPFKQRKINSNNIKRKVKNETPNKKTYAW